MPKKQPTPKTSPTQKPSKKVLLLSIAAASIILVASVCILRGYMEQQKTLDELSAASKDLRVVYDKLLTTYGNSVTESYFRNECTESSVEIGRGVVTCGPSGSIKFGSDIGRDQIRTDLRGLGLKGIAFENVTLSKAVNDTNDLSGDLYVMFKYKSDNNCIVTSSFDSESQRQSYYLTCRARVPDFLPGYIVVR